MLLCTTRCDSDSDACIIGTISFVVFIHCIIVLCKYAKGKFQISHCRRESLLLLNFACLLCFIILQFMKLIFSLFLALFPFMCSFPLGLYEILKLCEKRLLIFTVLNNYRILHPSR